MTSNCSPDGWRERLLELLHAWLSTRLLVVGVTFSFSLVFALASQPLSAAVTACHYSAEELNHILGAQLSAVLASPAAAANTKGLHNAGGPSLSCEGRLLSIDASRMPAPVTLKLGVPAASVQNPFPFAGLASYYQRMMAIKIDGDSVVTPLELPAKSMQIEAGDWVGIQGRYIAFLVAAPGAMLELDKREVRLRWPAQISARMRVFLGEPVHAMLQGAPRTFDGLRYAHLWDWLAGLCLGIEKLLLLLHGAIAANWGVAIILLAVTLKLLLLPISLFTAKAQAKVNRLQAQLQPKLRAIKANSTGEEAHRRSMAAYKSLGVSPFFTLRPLPGTLIQLPILVASFNVLGEMPQLQGAAFLWIDDLAYPDAIALLPFTLPAMGSGLNLLPFIMLLVSLLASVTFNAPHSSATDARRQKRNLYLMSAAFFLLFYPFPAAMVLYWTMNNGLQLIQQRVLH